MTLVLQLLIVATVVCHIAAYRLVAAPEGTCITKRAYGIIRIKQAECVTMGGRWNYNPRPTDWINCHLDWCELRSSGPITTDVMWQISTNQTSRPVSHTVVQGSIRMTRGDCDNLRGLYNNNPSCDEWIECKLYWQRMDGSARDNLVDCLIHAGVGECENKVAFGIIRMIQKECLVNGGTWNHNPGANDWTDCHFDICPSPEIQCTPSDLWSIIRICRNPSSSVSTCSFAMETGIEKVTSSESINGGPIDTSITQETGEELEEIFSASLSVSVTTGFEWSSTVGSHQIWSESTTRKLQVQVGANRDVEIQQVVGMCGDYKVNTNEYRIENTPSNCDL